MKSPQSSTSDSTAPIIRTRFAPSPTGFMHVGGVRTALFAYLVAHSSPNGRFILRLEDTDKKREVEGSGEHLMISLKALGIFYDEGPDIGGEYAPYKQSERLDTYKKWAQKLIDKGRAYADPYTAEQIQEFRDLAKSEKRAFLYRNHRPEQPPVWDGTMPLRLKSDPKKYAWHDEVMGDLKTGPEVIDDIILIKSDGYPTYNFAHIIDDVEMEITHIIRGQEFIASQPNYFNIYEALDITPPIFATMPHILNEVGNKKLGKRDGAKDVLEYIKEGFLPEALINFIASMGWNDGTEQEIFTRNELIEKFSLNRVQHSGARFDEKRLLWMNGQHIRLLTIDELFDRSISFWSDKTLNSTNDQKKLVLKLVQDRLKTLCDIPLLTDYFFAEPTPDLSMISDNKQLSRLPSTEIVSLLENTKTILTDIEFTPESIQQALNNLLEITGQKPGILFGLIRLAISWAPFSPALNDTISVLGKEKVIARINLAINKIS